MCNKIMFWACLWTISKFFFRLARFCMDPWTLQWRLVMNSHWHYVQFGLPFSVKVYWKLLDEYCLLSSTYGFFLITHSKSQKAQSSEVQKWSKQLWKSWPWNTVWGNFADNAVFIFGWSDSMKYAFWDLLLYISGYRNTSFR